MAALLSRLSLMESKQLCHRVVDWVCGREPPRLVDYSATYSLDEWLELQNTLSSLFQQAMRSNGSDEEILAGFTSEDRSYGEALLSVLKARQEEIHQALVEKSNAVSSNTLQDFDWQLKLALSSDKMSSLHTPLLSLSLDLRENGALHPVTVEMNREELNNLISSLEAANKVVLQLK